MADAKFAILPQETQETKIYYENRMLYCVFIRNLKRLKKTMWRLCLQENIAYLAQICGKAISARHCAIEKNFPPSKE